MGWEWRVFCPLTATTPTLWALLECEDKGTGSVSTRTDYYLPCLEGIGVKLRGGSQRLEIKMRSARTEEGLELWGKAKGPALAVGAPLEALLKGVDKVLGRGCDAETAAACRAALVALGDPPKGLGIEKRQEKRMHKRIVAEQADLTIDGVGRFRSFSLEGAPDDVAAVLLESRIGDGRTPEGYPAFVARIAGAGQVGGG